MSGADAQDAKDASTKPKVLDDASEAEETEDDTEAPDDEKAASVPPPRKEPAREAEPLRFSATTVAAVAILVAAGAFAAGRSMTPSPPESTTAADKPAQGGAGSMGPSLGGGGGGGMGAGPGEALPPGHPPTGDLPPNAGSGAGLGLPGAGAAVEPAALAWKAPARWQLVPNASTMRLATYRIPHAPGDSEDPELTITQAGGTVEANMQRWMGQFGAEGAKTAKRSNRTVKPFEIALLEVEGKFASGMGKEGREEDQWAMLGAIVQTPGMPHFFKLTGPAKSVKASKAEFDAFVGSVTPK